MVVLITLLTLTCYGLAGYLWWRERSSCYLFALLGGHLAMLPATIWARLYGYVYNAEYEVLAAPLNQAILQPIVLSGAWYYPLPALTVLWLYNHRWWFPGYLPGLLTYLMFVFYHVLLQAAGVQSGAWMYLISNLPLDVPGALLMAILDGLISTGVLYLLLLLRRQAPLSVAFSLIPAPLAIVLLVRGVLGAPVWVPLLLSAETWALWIGQIGVLLLVAWAVHLAATGLATIEPLRRTGRLRSV